MRYFYELSGAKVIITRQYYYDSTPLQFRYVFELWIKKDSETSWGWMVSMRNHGTFTKCLLAAIEKLNEIRADYRKRDMLVTGEKYEETHTAPPNGMTDI